MKEFYDTNLRDDRSVPWQEETRKLNRTERRIRRAKARPQRIKQIRLKGKVYDNGRVANPSIVSKDSPAWFKLPYQNNVAFFQGSTQKLRPPVTKMRNIGR